MRKVCSILIILLFSSQIFAQDDRPKIGLVLSGGGARGFAHIGVLKMLDSLNFPVDYIAGTSIGGLIGALYACGYKGAEIEKIVNSADWDALLSDTPARNTIPYLQKYDDSKYQIQLSLQGITPVVPSGLIQGQKICLLISELLVKDGTVYNFNNLKIPLHCVAVDLISGNEVILQSGSLAQAMRATMSIPTIFSPVEWGDSLLIDGGLVNNFPADVVKDMGADIIIGVDIGSRLAERKELNSLIGILNQTFVLTDYDRQIKNRSFCKMILTPDLKHYSSSDFDNEKIRDIQKKGEEIAQIYKSDLEKMQFKYNLYKKSDSMRVHPDSVHNKFIVYGISITGNQKLKFSFIYRLLGIKPNDIYDKQLLNQRIDQLYGLGYFEKINYQIEMVTENSIRIIITVKEKSFRKFRIGLHYDNYYELVARLGVQSTSTIIPGARLETSLEFAGLINYNLDISYPSRNLNLPVYPYIRFNYKDIPVNIYNPLTGDKAAEYSDGSYTIGGGFGILLGRSGTIVMEYNHEQMDIDPRVTGLDTAYNQIFDDRLRKFRANLKIDMLDNSMLPRNGIYLNANVDAAYKELKSDVDYQQYQISLDMYKTVFNHHTISIHSFYTNFDGDIPIYKYAYKGGAKTFVGMSNDQLIGDKFGYVRLDYRYQYKKDIFLKLILNSAAYDLFDMAGIRGTSNLYGYGLGIKLLSILGTVELIVGQGSKSLNRSDQMQTRVYFCAGYPL
jgi:NTE family protein